MGTNPDGGKFALKISLGCLFLCLRDLRSGYKLKFSLLDPNLQCALPCDCVDLNFSSCKLIVSDELKQLSQRD